MAKQETEDKRPDLQAGDVISIRWDPSSVKRARFVRWNANGGLVVNVQRVDQRGNDYLNSWGSDRTFAARDFVEVLERAKPAAPAAKARR